ncbi:hypothetical protein [Chryseobacterium sp.]|jgi:hypothetical protein|uniref:hypothetical protein n=1 Tax=Chryseobacterium sp. TaxID=1871047 RepID=UPI002841699D|nr:hypothetical protein [Chryseobacterium sp.]MDR3026041.1 hypothetical protein [Chryseobacterium sp.]
MKTYKITLESIKNLKAAFEYADEFRDNNSYEADYNTTVINEGLVNSYDEKANNEAKLISEVLNIPVITVIDMAYDLEFAKEVLNQVYAA